jgi:hypothetical protein
VKNTVRGALSAWGEDNGLGGLEGEQTKTGRAIGHVVAIAQGTVEMNVGTGAAAGGFGEALLTAPAGVQV